MNEYGGTVHLGTPVCACGCPAEFKVLPFGWLCAVCVPFALELHFDDDHPVEQVLEILAAA